MADTYRLMVLKKLTEHLKKITKANGYDFDLANNVFRGRTIFGENDPIPLVSILESPRSDPGQFAGDYMERSEKWSLLIQGWAHDDIENPTDPLYGLMDAVERHLFRLTQVSDTSGFALYPDEYRLGGLVGSVEILPGVVRPPTDQVSSKAFFYLPVRIALARSNG